MQSNPQIAGKTWAARRIASLVHLLLAAFVLVSGTAQASESSDDVNRPIKDKWAVVIGVSKFADPAIPRLKYPAKDAQDFYTFLTTKGNFAKDHVLLLKDEQASKVNVLDAFGDGWLPRRVMKDDLVVIFISSHGSPADVAGENFVIAYDSDPDHTYATGIRLQDLASEVTKRTGCDRLIVLLDACHSGAAVAEEKGLQRASTNFKLESITGTGQLVISSSSPAEVSWESKRYKNGVFTKNLIDSLQINGPATKISDAFKHLQDSVAQEVRFDRIATQTPLMLSRWTGQDLAFSSPPSEPRVVPDAPVKLGSSFVSPNVYATRETLVGVPVIQQNKSATAKVAQGLDAAVHPPMMTESWIDKSADVTLERGTRLLSEGELKVLGLKDLERLYNEAYARHGRGFLSRDLQQYFNSKNWYRADPDYHWRQDDPAVVARKGVLDDSLIINNKRTPKQWSNMMLIKKIMDQTK